MDQKLKDSKIVKYILIGAIVFFLVAAVSIGAYYLIVKQEQENKIEQEEINANDNKYPKETIIEESDKEGVYKVTPSKEDTIQVKNADGEYVEIPKPGLVPAPKN